MQEVITTLRSLIAYYCLHKNLPLASVLCQIDQAHTPPPWIFTICLNYADGSEHGGIQPPSLRGPFILPKSVESRL
jgi:hypothetical protein